MLTSYVQNQAYSKITTFGTHIFWPALKYPAIVGGIGLSELVSITWELYETFSKRFGGKNPLIWFFNESANDLFYYDIVGTMCGVPANDLKGCFCCCCNKLSSGKGECGCRE